MLLTIDDKPKAAPGHTMLLQLRQAAQTCSNVDYRKTMYDAADKLGDAISAVYADPTEDNMITLNGAWAHADRVFKNVPPEGGPAPLGGSTRPTLFETSPAAVRRAA